jgi:hypothetical protein
MYHLPNRMEIEEIFQIEPHQERSRLDKAAISQKVWKRLPLLITLFYFATGDYLSLVRHLRFFLG